MKRSIGKQRSRELAVNSTGSANFGRLASKNLRKAGTRAKACDVSHGAGFADSLLRH